MAIARGLPSGLRRGALVVCLEAGPAAAVAADTVRTLQTARDGAGSPLVVWGADDVLAELIEALADGVDADVWATTPDDLARRLAPADLLLLGVGARLGAGALGAMRRAAGSDPLTATVSGLSGDARTGADAPTGAAGSAPRIRRPGSAAVLVRRSALELVGGDGLGLEADRSGGGFLDRCADRGLAHRLAPGASVEGAPVFGPSSEAEPAEPEMIDARLAVRAAAGALEVLIDARALTGPPNGTRAHLLELLGALDGAIADAPSEHRVSALVPASAPADVGARLAALARVRLLPVGPDGLPPGGTRADVLHRPHQIESPADLAALAGLAPRLVLTQQDLIAFHNPGLFASTRAWDGYRELTRTALVAADRVLFFSAHARAEALDAGLVEPQRSAVVAIGTDHAARVAVPRSASGSARLAGLAEGGELLLCLGTDLRHKNRPFALALAGELRRRHGWTGRLVLVGPRVRTGGTAEEERRRLAADPELVARVIELGDVDDAERDWLLAHAGLVLYPTVQEGFGLVPHEAAAHGTPTLWAPGSALAEYLGEAQGGIEPWDPVASADAAWALLTESGVREAQLTAIRAAGRSLTWAACARALLAEYGIAAGAPAAPGAALLRGSALMDGAVSPDGLALVGPDGLLPRDAERPLLAVLSRTRPRAILLSVLRRGYALARR